MFFPVLSFSARVSARFILGGKHGRFKYSPPKGFAAVCESVLPKERLKIEPCFSLGDVTEGIIQGPTASQDHSAFIPAPVDTSTVSLPGYIEMLRDKLAENIHELWCMNKIEAGWTWGPVRDDAKKVHDSLMFFSSLSEQEKNFDITMAYETLRTLIALGYHISIDEETSKSTLKRLRLPMNYLMSNGYKPAPYNLSNIHLNPKMEKLVELLAENAHNVWAKDRIAQGWTYGLSEETSYKRNPQLVPYNQLNDQAKKLNRDTASETIRTILGFGYALEPPTSEGQDPSFRGLAREMSDKKQHTRTFRAEKSYAVTSGKWYFEFEAVTSGYMRVGWGRPSIAAGAEIGTGGISYVFDGFLARKWHQGSETFGKTWSETDVIGCMLNLVDNTISFTMNGEFLSDSVGSEMAFLDIEIGEGFVPVCMLAAGEKAHLHFGQDVNDLKYFTVCGLQEGYEPFCVNMKKSMPLWYSKSQPMFQSIIEDEHDRLGVTRIPAGIEGPPCLKVSHKKCGTVENLPTEYLRLSMPVVCKDFPTSGEMVLSIPVPILSPGNKRGQWIQHGAASLDLSETDSNDGSNRRARSGLDKMVVTNGYRSSTLESDSDFDTSVPDPKPTPPPSNHHPHHHKGRRHRLLQKHKVIDTDAIDVDGRVNGYNGDTKELTKKEKKKLASLPLGRKIPMSRAASSETSTVQSPDSSFERSGPSPAKSKRSKFTKSASMDSGAKHPEDTLAKPSGYEVDGQRSPGAARRGKKSDRLRTPEASPPGTLTREYIPLKSDNEGSVGSDNHGRPRLAKLNSMGSSFDVFSKSIDIMSDISEADSIDLSMMTKFYFSVRIFPGQDPTDIHVGWVTPGYHHYSPHFDPSKTSEVTVNMLGENGGIQETSKRRDCFTVCVGDHMDLLITPEGRRISSGLVVGCIVDASNGELNFTINGRDISTKYQVEPKTKLFPAVFVKPTSKEMLQFELGRSKILERRSSSVQSEFAHMSVNQNCLPLSAAWFRGDSHNPTPQCPSRVEVQDMHTYTWARAPLQTMNVETKKVSDNNGWLVSCPEPVSWLGVHIPEENRSMDILELVEHEDLLKFHAHTLRLYCSVCSHGNHHVAHALINHVNEDQLMYCLQCPYISGPLRIGYYKLLHALHLQTHVSARLKTQDEFIIPLMTGPKPVDEELDISSCMSIKRALSTTKSVSIRPQLNIGPSADSSHQSFGQSIKASEQAPPSFNLKVLKQHVITSLGEAVAHGVSHCRDPIGGNYNNLFVPLLQLCDALLVIGEFDDDDLKSLLILIDPATFDETYKKGVSDTVGMLQMHLDEPVKLAMCFLLQHLCDSQLRHRVESIINFSDDFVEECQADQLRRFLEVRNTDMPPVIAAKKTREFRSTPQEQMRMLLNFKEGDDGMCPCREDLRSVLQEFHSTLAKHCGVHETQEERNNDGGGVIRRFLSWLSGRRKDASPVGAITQEKFSSDSLSHLISNTMIKWAEEKHIEDPTLVREMFNLLHRQYDGVGELCRALQKSYVVSSNQCDDIVHLLTSLGQIRSLLTVQMGSVEEEALIKHLWELTDNKVFYQHPDLMRALCVHETVMNVMVNVLEKHQTSIQLTSDQEAESAAQSQGGAAASTAATPKSQQMCVYRFLARQARMCRSEDRFARELIASCCRFLCYFCRTSRQNQRALFDKLLYLLDHGFIGLSYPSLRGSCPLDVAAASLMDNNELALALREQHLEKVIIFLSRCGVQDNARLRAMGKPLPGWDPLDGERYLDFMRHAVWVNGETVEENANLIVRLLIRHPECLGPALRGEGKGLLAAMEEAIDLSETAEEGYLISAPTMAISEEDGESRPIDGQDDEGDEDEDDVDTGGAILTFYATLIDLLGRCAPDENRLSQGRTEPQRIRAILQSLVPLDDLVGVLNLKFVLPSPQKIYEKKDDGAGKPLGADLKGLTPVHKEAMLLFLERVYGIGNQELFFELLEVGFLPDLRAATTMDTPTTHDHDMALALNRYICNSVLPLLTRHSEMFESADQFASLLDSTLHTVYRLASCRSLTRGQRDTVADFLVALTRSLKPSMMQRLLRKLINDVPILAEYSYVALKILQLHYERCVTYYGSSGGWGSYGAANDEEKRLTMMLFTGLFDALAEKEYDEELFDRALPCLTAIGSALPPDYSMSYHDESYVRESCFDADGIYQPKPVDTNKVLLNESLLSFSDRFAEHLHDSWALAMFDNGWTHGETENSAMKESCLLRPYKTLTTKEKDSYREPVRECIKALLAWGWAIERSKASEQQSQAHRPRRLSKASLGAMESPHGYNPRPIDVSNITLTREMQNMAERLAENAHDVWAKKTKLEMELRGSGCHTQMVPFDILTDSEKKKDRDMAHALLKFLQVNGYRLQSEEEEAKKRHSLSMDHDGIIRGHSTIEKRFAFNLLDKLLHYVDKSQANLKPMRRSQDAFRSSKKESSGDRGYKFFAKVVLPLIEKYFQAHSSYFVADPNAPQAGRSGGSSTREKELVSSEMMFMPYASHVEKAMVASLFCKLAQLIRQKINLFGRDLLPFIRCIRVVAQSIDARVSHSDGRSSVVKHSADAIKNGLLVFFRHASDDLIATVESVTSGGRFTHIKSGQVHKHSLAVNYVPGVLVPVLISLFQHLARHNYGADLLLDQIQVYCYRILSCLYRLGADQSIYVKKLRPAIGELLAAFSGAFPVAFLEPHLNKNNPNSLLGQIELRGSTVEGKDELIKLASGIPTLPAVVTEIDKMATSGAKYDQAPHVIEVILPMLCSYLNYWWQQGPDNICRRQGNYWTMVNSGNLNNTLGNVLTLVKNNLGSENAPWMSRIAATAQPILNDAQPELLKTHFVPVVEKLEERTTKVSKAEEDLKKEYPMGGQEMEEAEFAILEDYHLIIRDLYAFYPLLIKFVDSQRSQWLKLPSVDAEKLYYKVSSIFNSWARSANFRREEQNYVAQTEVDSSAALTSAMSKSGGGGGSSNSPYGGSLPGEPPKLQSTAPKRPDGQHGSPPSLILAALKRLLPIGMNQYGAREQELVQQAKLRFGQKETDKEVRDYLLQQLHIHEKEKQTDSKGWQRHLYNKMAASKLVQVVELTKDKVIERIINMAQVLHRLHQMEHPSVSKKSAWRRLMSAQRKRAIMACFRMIPLHHLPRHRAINYFLKAYKEKWLSNEESAQHLLIDDLTKCSSEELQEFEAENVKDPLYQLILTFSRAFGLQQDMLDEDFLYQSYADIMSKSCSGGEDDDDDDDEGEDNGTSFQEQEMEKQKLLSEQARLAERGCAEMVLLLISASKDRTRYSYGEPSDMVFCSLKLGISLLRGGNELVQRKMLEHLQDKMDVGFFTSVAELMEKCTVLDLEAFERYNKAEGLGVTSGENAGCDGLRAGEKAMHDAEFTCALFRFLQLLCEGHNLEFQNYLRTQAGNHTTVNIIICTVDYLLRLQESISDFYWHYSGKDVVDAQGRENFSRAFKVVKQVFSSLTEYIQGPCSGNQLALAHSRLWDAVVGFLHIFANLQKKLSQDTSQLELLRELLNLHKEMVVMLLSMLEGNVMHGTTGKQMVDTLVESSSNLEMILKFFDMFLKLKDLSSSEAFKEYDANGDGWISHKEFQKAMEAQKMYTADEIDYLLKCADRNNDGRIDFNEFTERFHGPAQDIGFNLAVLLTNLADHMPGDRRLERFLLQAESLLVYFEPYLGRIEIMGSSRRIERVYFKITESHKAQWEKPQIKESKQQFLHEVVNEGGEKEKLEDFVNFCEDTIFEMQHATSISDTGESLPEIFMSLLTFGASRDSQNWLVWAVRGLRPSNIRRLTGDFFSSSQYNIKQIRSMSLFKLFFGIIRLTIMGVFKLFKFAFVIVGKLIGLLVGTRILEDAREITGSIKHSLHVPRVARRQTSSLINVPGYGMPSARRNFGFWRYITSQYFTNLNSMDTVSAFGIDFLKGKGGGGNDQYKLRMRRKRRPLTPSSSFDFEEEMSMDNMPPHTPSEASDSSFDSGAMAKTEFPMPDMSSGRRDSTVFPSLFLATEMPSTQVKEEEEEDPVYEPQMTRVKQTVLSLFARNFYNIKYIALALVFCINFLLLFFKVSFLTADLSMEEVDPELPAEFLENSTSPDSPDTGDGEDGSTIDDVIEQILINQQFMYLVPILKVLAILHSLVSISMLIAYCALKVPLCLFKREKEIARKLEFDGQWITEQPTRDDIKGQWDSLAISTVSFPVYYWDKFVKKKVLKKYEDAVGEEKLCVMLGMEVGENPMAGNPTENPNQGLFSSMLTSLDWKYHIWKCGVIGTDNSFLYIAWYLLFSLLGHVNHFFFAAHLLDIAMGFKTLRTVLQSVTHNGKQLVLTLMMTCVIIYLYTVVAFNFFRKFYTKDEEGEIDYKCHNMMSCFVFHLHSGLRAGGGIADEIEPPDGDDYEFYRIIFDITFFFFVIVILLAIIQGLIIDAFGELRDQLEQVKEDMETKCFICSIGREYFDKLPHGFELHTSKEHDLSNYMFFLMYLINKPETEHTGQESYVWQLYQQRCWDFFPVGDCFRKQYDDEQA
ncbi:ryanodine receptor 2-like isoform X1 [Lytechinus variegatus]|uniref:ryanodine receptor 2-like isoform X1 n=1 Tax=Lytechinus variegatus TaxID=7654 RepID=UPI001BB2BBF9|nr:ryanodine receptor 2-like isoform X1 [Lytechinus variegatus]